MRQHQPSVRELVERARAAWPGVEVAEDTFERHLAAHLPAGEQLHALNTTDLYLACAAATGDATALAVFESHVLAKIAAHLTKTGLPRETIEEVMQQLRERLLVPQEGRLPRIATFAGRGSLVGWVRMAAARIAINIRAKQRPAVPIDDGFDLVNSDCDPALDLIKRRYGKELREAFHAALASLPSRDAAILRLHFLDGMSAQAIGSIYRVHPRTVQKWLALAHKQILATTRELLQTRLQLDGDEIESLIELVRSQLAVSLSRVLKH